MHHMAATSRLAQIVDHKTGATRRDEALAMSKMRGKKHHDLDYPDMPGVFIPISNSYSELSGSELSYQELKAYRDMTGVNLDWFDISILKDIDYIRKSATNGRTVEQILEAFGYGEDIG